MTAAACHVTTAATPAMRLGVHRRRADHQGGGGCNHRQNFTGLGSAIGTELGVHDLLRCGSNLIPHHRFPLPGFMVPPHDLFNAMAQIAMTL